MNNANPADVTAADSPSFKYKSNFFKALEAAENGVFKNGKIAVPLKNLSNFCRTSEMPLINCKINLKLNWAKDCVMSTIVNTTFKITNTKLYAPIVTLSSKDNIKLAKQLNEGFKKSVYWNEYIKKIWTKSLDNNTYTRFLFAPSIQGVRRLFVLAFNNTSVNVLDNLINNVNNKVERNSHTKYFLPRVNIGDYNVVIFKKMKLKSTMKLE